MAKSRARFFADLVGVNNLFDEQTSLIRNDVITSTGVQTGTFGSASVIPVITVAADGRITNIANTVVAGVTGVTFYSGNNTLRIATADGSEFDTTVDVSDKATWNALISTNTALRTVISDRMQVANVEAYLANTNAYIAAAIATELSHLANTNAYIASTAATGASNLANTNAYIATKVNTSTFNSALANTNAYISSVSAAERSALANTNAYIASTASTELSHLANTNSYIAGINASKASWSALQGTNTAIRTLVSDRIQVANAVSTFATWSALTATNTSIRSAISSEVASLVDSAPTTLDTLNELAAALGDDPNFATTLTTNLGQKLGSTASITLTGDVSGSGSFSSNAVSISVTVADDSHNHIIGNVDGLQTALDSKSTWSALTSTNTAIRTLVSARLQVANAAATYQTITTERAALANTNAYIATKLNSSSYTASDVLTKIKTVDGSGSGLDADLLDGQHGSYYYSAGNPPPYPAESDTLATVTARGASTSTSVTLSGNSNVFKGHFYFDAYDANGNHYPHFRDGSSGNGVDINWRLYTGGTNSHTHIWNTSTAQFVTKLESTVRVDAPIFYDRNNTGYYTDPASTSNFNTLNVATINRNPTVTLSGDVTGSATMTNLGSINISTTVGNDSHTHSIYVLKTGDTMTGALTINSNDASITLNDTSGSPTDQGIRIRAESIDVNLPGSEGLGIIFEESPTNGSPDTTPAIITTGEFYAQSDQKVFHDNYHPNADKWTTARTLTLTGDVTGSVSWDGSGNASLTATVADDSHNHVWGNIDGGSVNSWGGLRHSTSSGYIDFGPANSSWAHIYTDMPGFYFNKELYVTGNRVFNDGYHPNADKWTTARTNTVTLTGDVTGTGNASVDGTGNWTVSLSTTVGNDSHSHSNYVLKTGDTMTGDLTFSGAASSIHLNEVGQEITFGESSGTVGYIRHITGGQLQIGSDNLIDFYETDSNVLAVSISTNSKTVTASGGFIGNASSASKWATARTLSLTGDVTGSVSWDGSGNASMTTTVGNDSHTHSNYLPLAGGNMSGNIGRTGHAVGYLVGSYNSVGNNSSKSNPIYTIGSGYQPYDTDLNNMCGIGFSHPNAAFDGINTVLDSWGLYVASNGYARVGLDGANGRVRATGAAYIPIYYDYSNTSYYADPASTSRFANLVVDRVSGLTGAYDYKDIVVYGDANTYYPVIIAGQATYTFGMYGVDRHYSATAPNTWNTSTHKGGLTFNFMWSGDTAWGGNDHSVRVIQFSQTYSTMVAGLALPVTGGVCVWLRGGTAAYRVRTPLGYNAGLTVYDGYSGSDHSTSTTYTAGNGATYSPRTDTSNVSSEINARMPISGNSGLYDNGNRVLDQGSGNQTKSGYIQSNSSLRSPIFYDSNNTGYYADPASTSNFNAANFAGVIDANGGAGAINITNSDIRSSATSNWTGNPGANGKIQYHSNRWYIVSDSSSNRIVQFRRDGSDKSYVDNDGRWIGSSDVRGTVFHDVGNTGYYLDAASGGTSLNIAGGISTPTMWVNHSTGNYNNYNENIRLFPAGNSVSVIAFGASGTSGVPWNSILGYSDRLEVRQGSQWQQRSYANYVEAYGSFRAPIFYDSNNTGYYANPASTSIFNDFRCDIMYDKDNTAYYVRPGSTSIFNDARANIWYSRSNTGYYSDPESTSNLNTVNAVTINRNPTVTLSGDVTGSATMTNLGSINISTTVGNDSHTHSNYVSKSGDTMTGTLNMGSQHIVMQESHYINRRFEMIENASPQWILLCRDAGSNDVNGTIRMDRTSGNYQAASIDVVVSSTTNAVIGGALRTLQLLQSSEDYRLVAVTYGGAAWIAIKYTGNTYPETTGAYFTGRLVTTGGTPLTVVSSGITNEVPLGGNSESYNEVSSFVVSGSITAAGNVTAYSDIRVKADVQSITNAAIKLQSLNGVTYNRTDLEDKTTRYAGLIAQDIVQVLPEAVSEDTLLRVDYNAVTALLVEAIKEQQTEIDDLKSTINILVNKLNKLID